MCSKKTKKLSNRERKENRTKKGNLRSLSSEVAHTHKKGTCSTSMILNYGHSENKRQVIRQPKKKIKFQNKLISTDFYTL